MDKQAVEMTAYAEPAEVAGTHTVGTVGKLGRIAQPNSMHKCRIAAMQCCSARPSMHEGPRLNPLHAVLVHSTAPLSSILYVS